MSSQKSKRLLCKLNAIVLLIMLISLCAAVFGAEEPNIFINGGFELLDANGLPVGWRKYTPVGGSPDNLQLSAEAYAGERAVLIDVRDLDRARITWIQPFIGILEPSATYKFSAYYRTDGDPRARLQAQIYSETGTQLDERPSLELPPSIDWRLAELIFTYPQEAHRIQLGLWVWLGGRGRVWFDEASLVKIEKGGTHIVPVDSENISETGEHLFPSNFPPPIEFDLSQAKDFSQPLSMEELRSRIPQGRPRLFARPETLEELRQKKDRPGFAALIWNKIRTSARSAVFKPLPPEPPDPRPGGQFNITLRRKGWDTAQDIVERLDQLAFSYLITEDLTYGEAGKKLLLHVASWDPNGSTSRINNDEASMRLLYSLSRAYDWLYPLLTPEERALVQETMRIRGNDIYLAMRAMKFEDHLRNNHFVRTMGFLGQAAIAFMGELPEAEVWFDYIVSLYILKFPPWGKEEGGWSQGVTYWQGYISWSLEFVDALKVATGLDLYQKEFYRNTGYFKLYGHPPKSKIAAFGDRPDIAPSRVNAELMSWFATVYKIPAYKWYADQIDGMGQLPSLPNNFLGYIRAPESSDQFPPAPALTDAAGRPIPQSRLFTDVGWALMNVDMQDWDNNVHIKFKSSPYGSISHGHAEQNSFIIEAYGSPLAISSGYYPWYGSPHHAQWTWESRSKNTILVDGKGQGVQSLEAKGKITHFVAGDKFDYVAGDATQAYEGRIDLFERQLFFVKPNIIAIYDRLEAGRQCTYDWLLHSLKQMEVDADAQTVRVVGDTAEMWTYFVYPETLSFEQTDQFTVPPEERDADKPLQWHLTAKSQSAADGSGRFLTLIFPRPNAAAGEVPPKVRGIAAQNGHAAQIEVDGKSYTVAFRDSDKAMLQVGELITDAKAIIVKKVLYD